ncbi:MAG TPA: EAL domain-containing protein [Leptolyngbyaceae cyanobacterium]
MSRLLRVLLIEDSEDDALLVLQQLQQGGYTLQVKRVETALAMKAALQETWDIVIADYSLPQFNGLAALKLVQETGQDLPFIIVSGHIGEELAVAAMKAGVHDYVMKNNLTRLLVAVERELREASVRQERQRAEFETRLLQNLIHSMMDLDDCDDALEVAIRQICDATGWNYGEAWIPNASETFLECSSAWYSCSDRLILFRQQSEKQTYPPGIGLPGRVWVSKQPEWHRDISIQPADLFPRAAAAKKHGLKAALAIPIMVGDRVLSVLVFLMFAIREEDKRMIEIVTTGIGHLGSILQRKWTAAALKASEQRFRSLIENASDIILILDAEAVLTYVSPSVKRILGYIPEQVVGRSAFEFISPEDLLKVSRALERSRAQPNISQPPISLKVQHGNRQHCILEAVVTNLLDDPAVSGLVVNCHEVTQCKEAEELLRRYAFYDALTGLPNRTLFLDRLGKLCKTTKEQNHTKAERENIVASGSHTLSSAPKFAVLFLDLDRFQVIKYSLGHLVADRLLIATAQRLAQVLNPECDNTAIAIGEYQEELPQNHLIARVGIDEFALLLVQIREIADAIQIANKIHASLAVPFNLDGHEVFTTATIGIALSNTGYDRPEDFLRAADTALYYAKLQGTSPKSAIFDISMHARAMAGLQLETDLRRAIERQEFVVHYQPIVSLFTGKAIGFEALVRWQHPQLGLVSPDAFIPLAEETGLIIPLGTWVLEEACQQMAKWQKQFPSLEPFSISVNIAGLQLAQANFIQQIDRILQETGLPGSGLKLELTESILMKTTEVTFLLKQLKSRQILLSIDDFGTGYSSLSRLHQWPLDTLKIDRSFINRLIVGEETLALVRTIVSLADNLGLEVIAEGVENAEQAYQLWALQCEAAQGYFFSRPLASEAATAWLKDKLKTNKTARNSPPS